ncbi:MAG TPA: glycosyltransferase [Nannocystis sp.]|jgi:glycosyltransferase involved in cell wall biosynthesis
MPRPWFIVSKPLRAPFRDGSTVLIRDLVTRMPGDRPLVYLGDPRRPLRTAADTILDHPAMSYSPGLLAKIRVLLAMLHPRRRHLPVQLCFTPNPITSRAVALLRWLQPRRVLVQSLMSAHGCEAWVPLLRPLDAIVVLSDHTRERLIGAGVDPSRVHRIYPAVASVTADSPDEVAGRQRLLYAGDLDLEVAARLISVAHGLATPELAGWSLTIACRPKSDSDAAARDRLRDALPDELASGRVRLLGEVDDMDALLRGASLQLYAADHVRRKVDLPLVLLEGLARGVPVVAVDADPVRELFTLGARVGLVPGAAAPADPEGFARVVAGLCRPEALRAASSAAAALAAREFSLDRMVRCYVALHDALEAP